MWQHLESDTDDDPDMPEASDDEEPVRRRKAARPRAELAAERELAAAKRAQLEVLRRAVVEAGMAAKKAYKLSMLCTRGGARQCASPIARITRQAQSGQNSVWCIRTT